MLTLVFFGFALSVNAAALDLTWSADQTIDLSSPDVDLTILSGSTASDLVVNTGTVVVTVASGDTFSITSASADFGFDPLTEVVNTCLSGNVAKVTLSPTSTRTYTLTPTSGACTYVAGGGSGGSGGGTYTPPVSPTIPTTPAIPATPATPGNEIPGCGNRTTGFSSSTGQSCVGNTSTTPAIPATPASPNTGNGYAFGITLVKQGVKGSACKAWQMFFNNTMNSGLVVDGNCGKQTIATAKAWQASVGLTADGKLGKNSRAKAMGM